MIPGILGNIGGHIAAAAGTYSAVAVNFDGTNDYLTRGASLTGAADGKQGTISFWLRAGSDNNVMRILAHDSNARVERNASELITIIWYDTVGSYSLEIKSSAGKFEIADGWKHFIASWDMSDTAKRHLYVSDVSDLTVTQWVDATLDYTVSNWSVGSKIDGTEKLNGDLADLWFALTYIDLSVESNRRKFISATGKPVDLGSDGSTPTGSQPIIFLKNSVSSWETNVGSGGGFTENGALTAASSSPSD